MIPPLDPWTWLTIGILSASIVALLFGLWVWRGIWLARNRGQMAARTRWHWYVQAERALRLRRVRKQIAQGKLPPPVTLEVHKPTHGQRTKFTRKV